jgi:hypothetical protein
MLTGALSYQQARHGSSSSTHLLKDGHVLADVAARHDAAAATQAWCGVVCVV